MLRYLPILVALGMATYCFFDVLATDRSRFGSLNKSVWLLVVLLPVIGAVLWLVVGRSGRTTLTHGDRVIQLGRRGRTLAPDDDPAFLRALDERAWRAKREALKHRAEESEQDGAADQAAGPPAAHEGIPPTDERPSDPEQPAA